MVKQVYENNVACVRPFEQISDEQENKAGYTATTAACGWAGAVFEVNKASRQEQLGQRPQKHEKYMWPTDGRTDKAGCFDYGNLQNNTQRNL